MPPKVKITRNEIVKAALDLLRREGESALNTRNIATALNCSTQPIFSNFATMEELVKAVHRSAYEYYLGFLKREEKEGKYPPYKAFGMAYVRFAKEERELFRFLFMCDRKGEQSLTSPDFEESIEMIMKANGVTRETASLMHMETWSCVHGIGTMLATSFLSLDEETVSKMLTDVYQGIRARHTEETVK